MGDTPGDDGTITVEIEPDNNSEPDANNNGIADGIEIGQAAANAENAVNTAESAEVSAQNAQSAADTALTISDKNSADIDTLAAATATNTAALNTLIQQVQAMTEVLKAQAQVTLENATPAPEPRPVDTEPRNSHWMQKSLFGRGK